MSEEDRPKTISGWLRPLSMPSIQVLPFEPPEKEIDPIALLRDLSRDQPENPLETIKTRYLRLSTSDLDIPIVPAEKKILERIIWPLKSAKQAFCIADFVGCIALCGMVCEMAIIFIYDLIASHGNPSQLSEKHKKLFEVTQYSLGGKAQQVKQYERYRQKQRIEILQELKAIPDQLAADANTAGEIRREYLHFLSKNYDRVEENAFEAYAATFRVVKPLVALPIGTEGAVVVPGHLKSYLESK